MLVMGDPKKRPEIVVAENAAEESVAQKLATEWGTKKFPDGWKVHCIREMGPDESFPACAVTLTPKEEQEDEA